MEAVVALADRLGKAIADSPQAVALRKARGAMEAESETAKLMAAFQTQSDKMSRLEAEQKPIEVEDKRKLHELHEKLVASDTFKQLSAAQVDYVDLMRKVSDAIGRQLGSTEGE